MVTVKVPATSANLGAGFDALGLAINLYNVVAIEEQDHLEILSLDSVKIPTDESNLVYSSAKLLYDHCGKPLRGLKIAQTNPIPMARGLGSSSACIVGGLLGANHLLGNPLTYDELLAIAVEIEGHPDNLAPAMLGGMVTALMEDGRIWYVKQEIKEDLQFLVIVPDVEMKTSVARMALPAAVPFQDACYNLARAALMTASIAQGKYENLKYAAGDRLHQPYRFRHIPYGIDVVEECMNLGAYAAMISGAGSTLLAMVGTDGPGIQEEIEQYLYRKDLHNWKVALHQADNRGATVK